MATYAIGDIQGCYHAFTALLKRLNFNKDLDNLWLVGDIINRGTGSLEMLRWCYANQKNCKLVLGNHDLHSLAVAHRLKREHKSDTLQALLHAPDGHALLTWLRNQPLMLIANDCNNKSHVMVHAGLLPQWTIDQARSLAKEVEAALQGKHYLDFLANMYGNLPNVWHDDLMGMDRLRVITNAMTRMRICTSVGEMNLTFKGELADVSAGYTAWLDAPNRQSQAVPIVCGHWSALSLQQRNNVTTLDTGCLWGGQLTALCLENRVITQVNFDVRDNVEPAN